MEAITLLELEHLTCKGKLRELSLFNLEKRCLQVGDQQQPPSDWGEFVEKTKWFLTGMYIGKMK